MFATCMKRDHSLGTRFGVLNHIRRKIIPLSLWFHTCAEDKDDIIQEFNFTGKTTHREWISHLRRLSVLTWIFILIKKHNAL